MTQRILGSTGERATQAVLALADSRGTRAHARLGGAGSDRQSAHEPDGQQLRDRHRRQPQARRRLAVDRLGQRHRDPPGGPRSGAGDDSFGQGTKEDTAVPTVVDGGIPPNKSDLKFFGVYQEGTSNGFLNLYWSRVQDPSGTTNMDFEFNQSAHGISSNGVTPMRTAGDLLITYDLSNGGTVPTLSNCARGPAPPGASRRPSPARTRRGSINTSPIPAADSDGLGAQRADVRRGAAPPLGDLPDPTGASRSARPT